MNSSLIPSKKQKIRVLIVDDSPLICDIMSHMLAEADDIGVIGIAENGVEAVRMTARLYPDVITMDIRMPRMDGMEAIRQIMQKMPTPIVVVANSIYDEDFNISFKAIEAGALTVVEKPHGLSTKDYETIENRLIAAVHMVANLKVVAHWPDASLPSAFKELSHSLKNRVIQVIAIATSTGGPGVLKQIFSQIPKNFAFPIVVVQHITPGFAEHMVSWLNDEVEIDVATAKAGDHIQPGKVLIAPSDRHLVIAPGGVIRLEDAPPIDGQRPSANRFFESVAQVYSSSAVGIILTGMGDDGAAGIEKLGKTGAHIIAQNEQSSIVFGMPSQAIQRGVVDEVLSPDEIAQTLNELHNIAMNLRKPAV